MFFFGGGGIFYEVSWWSQEELRDIFGETEKGNLTYGT